MKRITQVFLFLCIFYFSSANLYAQKIKIACIGNSVTAGYLLKSPQKDSYPSQLQQMVGEKYDVGNFGHSGATLLKKGHNPYYKTKEFKAALAFVPDIAIVHLGLNDTDPRNWPEFKAEFEGDYSWLLDTLRTVNPNVKLFICKLSPIFSGHPRFKSGTREWYQQIQAIIPAIANANRTGLIDLNKALHTRPELFADNLHPDEEGASIIAKTVYQGISGDFEGLKVNTLFSDHMVLQRRQPIPIYGTANSGAQIEVSFNQQNKTVTADQYGKWRAVFPAMESGKDLTIKVKHQQRTVLIKDILIGDIWICSGQSNMDFPLKASDTGSETLRNLNSKQPLRLLKFNTLAETNDASWDAVTLDQVNKLQYFSGSWKKPTVQSAGDFSAVAYYFAEQLIREEHVPIGLIQMAVGGSTMESWMDRATLENDDLLVDLLGNWRKSDFLQAWARGRADVNLKHATHVKQRHPYEPAYNYEAGISRLIDFPIKGVIWYQGESNAQNVELFNHEFPLMVAGWRQKWGTQFPFYYVQLSSINRPSWPYFRDAQRKIQYKIPNSGMAVSSDLGDSLDVHPVHKKKVGERLALLALKNTYGMHVVSSGPVIAGFKILGEEIVLSFNEAEQLYTPSDLALRGFELVNEKGLHLKAKAEIQDNRVLIRIPKGEKIKTVLYAWEAFSRANLTNEAGLPASTFSIDLNSDSKLHAHK